MAEKLMTTLRRNMRKAETQIDTAVVDIDRGWDKETIHMLRVLRGTINEICDGVEAAIEDRLGELEVRTKDARSKLANERYKNSKHPTSELVEHAIIHAQDLAAMVDMDEHGNEVRATLGLLKILLDESNGISPPKCGYNGNDPVGVLEEG